MRVGCGACAMVARDDADFGSRRRVGDAEEGCWARRRLAGGDARVAMKAQFVLVKHAGVGSASARACRKRSLGCWVVKLSPADGETA